MKSLFGTFCFVLTSTWMSSSVTWSRRSKNGMRKPALPIRTLFLRPLMMNALSGGALQ